MSATTEFVVPRSIPMIFDIEVSFVFDPARCNGAGFLEF
jgi:hypothetical protein